MPVLHILDIEKTVFGVTLNMASFILGFLVMGVILSILAYPIVYGIAAFLPNRGKRLRSHVKTN